MANACSQTIANRNCWSCDSRSLFFDLRNEESQFDSPSIMRLDVVSRDSYAIYTHGLKSCCGVPTCSPVDDRVVFIHADEPMDDEWQYCAWHRRGVVVRQNDPQNATTLDARDIVPPFTAGALRGGTHLHTFNHDATAIVSTYEDHVLAIHHGGHAEANRRGIAVHILSIPVAVPKTHPRNHDGSSFTAFVSQLADKPIPGSDEISMATGEAWLAGPGNRIAMQGTVVDRRGNPCVEIFLITLPNRLSDLCIPGKHPLQGTLATRPGVPAGVTQQRLTYTSERAFPGIFGPRHWAVSSADGSRIGFFMRDDNGTVQFWTVSPDSGEVIQVTYNAPEPTSPFTWHPDGSRVTYVADGSVMLVNISDGSFQRLTPRMPIADGPTHHACVFSPDGSSIAYMQPVDFIVDGRHKRFNQIQIVR
ncbi:MAG TPA: hypothetical protein DDZ51_15825 [Planctomycetaceae bacterium]|nr:hypothetical protein [Planctomycetaceae bacterium]